ncbi:VOC family protein [Singulisphaera sp. Ch08]|uniref:VOC family protein n=1 Tax=Singulisphaera sp. Ch08 TaxID=3120278 RepID=A0AAU7CC12_9BACT
MAKNRLVHFEIPADQPETLTKFYSDLFGWNFQKVPVPGIDFWLCESGEDGPGISGAVMKRQNPQQPVLNYVGVDNIDASIEKATTMGATVALPKMPVPGGRAIAVVIDPQGNLFGLLEETTP